MRGAVLATLAACGGSATTAPDAPSPVCDTTAPWAATTPLALGPTQETAVVAIDRTVFILGGFNDAAGVIPDVQAFDTTTCAYADGPPLPKPVHHANATVVDGTIYVLGALQDLSFTAIGDAWSWTPGEATWTSRASLPSGTERGAAVAVAVDGKIVVAGGFRSGVAVTDVSIYDPVLDAWTAGPALPAARDHACGGAIANHAYLVGGREGSSSRNAANVYELALGGSWVERAAMPTARGGTACGVLEGALIVTGGEGNRAAASGMFAEVEAYTPATDTWATLAPMPTPRHGMGAAATGGRLYVPGGASREGFGAVATHEVLTP